MLNISSTQPVIWPSVPPASLAPGSTVTAVAPVQSSARDTQAGLGQGREPPAPASMRRGGDQAAEVRKNGSPPDAAPLLPRDSPESPDGEGASELTEAQAEAKAQEQAEEKALKQQLQDVLSNVWKASAAVVDVVLGREAALAETPATGAPAAAEGAAATALPYVSALAANDGVLESVNARLQQDVTAYDAQGNGSWTPQEAGSLLSRRV